MTSVVVSNVLIMNGIQWASVFGLLLSFYALYVEHQAVAMPGYKAACDIESLGVSCSKVFKSKYGRMMSYFGVVPNGHALDQPNAVLGIAFYGIALLLPKMKFIPKASVHFNIHDGQGCKRAFPLVTLIVNQRDMLGRFFQ